MTIFFNLLQSYPPKKFRPETSMDHPESHKFKALRLALVRVKYLRMNLFN